MVAKRHLAGDFASFWHFGLALQMVLCFLCLSDITQVQIWLMNMQIPLNKPKMHLNLLPKCLYT